MSMNNECLNQKPFLIRWSFQVSTRYTQSVIMIAFPADRNRNLIYNNKQEQQTYTRIPHTSLEKKGQERIQPDIKWKHHTPEMNKLNN